MKAITICQPYAHLICLPETHIDHKRVENRTWPTNHRGNILIHAGKSKEWLTLDDEGQFDEEYNIHLNDMPFGAFVATAILCDCLRIEEIERGVYDKEYPWLRTHEHASGPWCWVLADVGPLPKPVPWRGAQGLWDADYHEVRRLSQSSGGERGEV